MRRKHGQKGFMGLAARGLMLLAGSMLLLSCLSVFGAGVSVMAQEVKNTNAEKSKNRFMF